MTSVVRFAVTGGSFGVNQLATRLKTMESAALIGPWNVGTWAGFTHQRSEVERYANSGNFRASLALRNVPVSKPRRVVVGRAPLPERLDA